MAQTQPTTIRIALALNHARPRELADAEFALMLVDHLGQHHGEKLERALRGLALAQKALDYTMEELAKVFGMDIAQMHRG